MKEYKNSDIERWIIENIHSERNRAILHDRFVDGRTFSELEDKYYLSIRQLKRIIKSADRFFINLL